MPTKNEVVLKQLAEIRKDVLKLWIALSTDPKKQKRKEQIWPLLAKALAAVAALGARQAATRLWMRVTEELPPPVEGAEKEAAKLRQKLP
jgi:hypothetical protein